MCKCVNCLPPCPPTIIHVSSPRATALRSFLDLPTPFVLRFGSILIEVTSRRPQRPDRHFVLSRRITLVTNKDADLQLPARRSIPGVSKSKTSHKAVHSSSTILKESGNLIR
ncbi:hypothetical protein E4T56_gene7749 [Termitomyces sp. T112]|nr:hypothetical protein E4T56_gene7749 [Termitomyces sp. T112]